MLEIGADKSNAGELIKDVNEDSPKTNNVTNNALFVGSTSELSKMLKKGFLNNKEEK